MLSFDPIASVQKLGLGLHAKGKYDGNPCLIDGSCYIDTFYEGGYAGCDTPICID